MGHETDLLFLRATSWETEREEDAPTEGHDRKKIYHQGQGESQEPGSAPQLEGQGPKRPRSMEFTTATPEGRSHPAMQGLTQAQGSSRSG